MKPCLQYGNGVDLRALLRSGAGDDEICETMRDIVFEKPACHQFSADAGRKANAGATLDAAEKTNADVEDRGLISDDRKSDRGVYKS